MKLSKMQITGFGYLDNVILIGNKTIIAIHLDANENVAEDAWLRCTACQEINNYIKRELLSYLEKGNAVLLKFCVSYEGFSEVLNDLENPGKRIVIFNANLKAIDAVYVNGSPRTVGLRQAIAV